MAIETSTVIYAGLLAAVGLYVLVREGLRLTVTSVMVVSSWLLYGAGHLFFYYGSEIPTEPRIRERVEYSLILFWPMLLFGVELARATFAKSTRAAESWAAVWRSTPTQAGPAPDQLLMVLALGLAGFYLLVFLILGKPGQIATFLTTATAGDALRFRIATGGEGGYLYHFSSMALAPFLAVLLLVRGRALRSPLMVASAVTLSIALVAVKLGTLHKIPWLIFLLQLAVSLTMVRQLQIRALHAIGYPLLILAGSFLAAYVSLPDYEVDKVFVFLFYRMVEIPNEVLYQAYYVYPEHIRHQWGMNIGLVHRLFGDGAFVSSSATVADFFGAVGATFNRFFIGDAWVDFGYWGVALMSFVVGFIVKALDVTALSMGKSPLAIALLVNGFYGVFQLQNTSAFTAMLSGGLLFVPLVALVVVRLWRIVVAVMVHERRGEGLGRPRPIQAGART